MWTFVGVGLAALIVGITLYDLAQRHHAILRNFPILGHFRYLFEMVGPELRQYIVTSNDEEKPFSRDERTWVYASAKRQNNYFGFGTDNDVEATPNYLIVRHAAFPYPTPKPGEQGYSENYRLPCAKVLGAHRRRRKAFRPGSLINISAMSYGSLSARAVEAINRGAAIAGCLQNTGEGGVAPYHRCGGELVWQIGTGYFGCRDESGLFSMERFRETVASAPVRAIEIKLSQGAKPGLGGVLLAAKITPEISQIRGIPLGKDCISPSYHTAFRDVDGLLDFVESLADETGLPVGIKSAVGELEFWRRLARLMSTTGRGVDFITIDGGEGGTGAAPLVFSDHVALPFKIAMGEVYRILHEEGVHENVVLIGSGRLGFPEKALLALALGCDMVNVGREAMMAVGCIQAQRCHTGHCPTGVATQSKWLMRGIDVPSKATRLANYIVTLRKELMWLANACGEPHPALITTDQLDIVDDRLRTGSVRSHFGYGERWGLPSEEDCERIRAIMSDPDAELGVAGEEVLAARAPLAH
jgi:glutamate synthase (ferredoxin)